MTSQGILNGNKFPQRELLQVSYSALGYHWKNDGSAVTEPQAIVQTSADW